MKLAQRSSPLHLSVLLMVAQLVPSSALAEELTHSYPESQGVQSRHIAEFLKSWKEDTLPIHSLLILRRGTIIHQTYAYPFSSNARHDIASCTKTVTALLVGIGIDKGKLNGLHATLSDMFPDRTIDKLDDRKRSMTLQDLLTMRSGLASLNDGLTLLNMQKTDDWVQFGLDLGMGRQPGKAFHYVSVNSHLMSAALEKAVMIPTNEYACEQLFMPLGITGTGWPTDPSGIAHGWGDLRMQPTDMAKLGLLLLQEGEWNGKQIVSREWVRMVTKCDVSTGKAFYPRYGFQCWGGDGYFAAIGRGGQRIIVVPDRDLIVVTTAGADSKQEAMLDQLCLRLATSVDSTTELVPVDPVATQQISTLQRALAAPPPKASVASPPKFAQGVGQFWYRLAPNPILDRVKLAFPEGNEARLELDFNPNRRSAPVLLPVGLDGIPRFGPGRYKEPAATSGTWVSPNTFKIDLDEVANINHWTMQLQFEGEGEHIELTMRDVTGLPALRVKGRRER